jgi:hypothetical protein
MGWCIPYGYQTVYLHGTVNGDLGYFNVLVGEMHMRLHSALISDSVLT